LRLRLPEVQQLVHQIEQPVGVQFHGLQIIPDVVRDRLGNQYILERTLYQCKRCTYLMRHIREEVYLRSIQLPLLFPLKLVHSLLMLLPGLFSEIDDYSSQ